MSAKYKTGQIICKNIVEEPPRSLSSLRESGEEHGLVVEFGVKIHLFEFDCRLQWSPLLGVPQSKCGEKAVGVEVIADRI